MSALAAASAIARCARYSRSAGVSITIARAAHTRATAAAIVPTRAISAPSAPIVRPRYHRAAPITPTVSHTAQCVSNKYPFKESGNRGARNIPSSRPKTPNARPPV